MTPLEGTVFDLKCGDCGKLMVFRTSQYGYFYGCSQWPFCRGTLSARTDGSPKGIPGNAATRKLRKTLVDLIRAGHVSSSTVYDTFEKSISYLNLEECRQILQKIGHYRPSIWERLDAI